ncbi:MAG TPA: phage holin family protein, partial [Edaphobacter sp.]|nr:phage holin family protein [Edaphobacter sp.]
GGRLGYALWEVTALGLDWLQRTVRKGNSMRWLLHWILNAVALLVVSHFVQGFEVSGFISALIAVVVIGLFNATLGLLLKFITLPLGIITFGLFFLVINAVVLWFSSKFVPGFAVTSFKAAFLGALALALIQILIGFLGVNKDRP